MKFIVTFKGIRRYCGKLASAYEFIEQQWGSCNAAWDMGVKLDPVIDPSGGR